MKVTAGNSHSGSQDSTFFDICQVNPTQRDIQIEPSIQLTPRPIARCTECGQVKPCIAYPWASGIDGSHGVNYYCPECVENSGHMFSQRLGGYGHD